MPTPPKKPAARRSARATTIPAPAKKAAAAAAKKAAAPTKKASAAPAKKAPAPAKKATAPTTKAGRRTAPATKAAPVAQVATATQATPVAAHPAPSVIEPSIGTDAAFAPSASAPGAVISTISDLRHALRTNNEPVIFVGATPFNLLGLDRWVRNFSYITYYDAWDGAHPRVFTPQARAEEEFASGEEINNWLLTHPEVREFIADRTPEGSRPKVAMVFFNEETERICAAADYDLILPSAELRSRLDSKLVTTRIADEVGVPSVPNVMATVNSWEDVREVASALGEDLVIQSAYGDSGKTTFFVNSAESFASHSEDIVGQEVKIMKRIDPRPVAVEAVITASGTIVGPFLSELTGHEALTPYRGGWCGNEMYPGVLSDQARHTARVMVQRLGDRLGKEGYRGFFEVDILVDTADDAVYLGELNPRISGASAITNVTAGAYADVPLFLFHLLEYLDLSVRIDVDELNARWERLSGLDEWSQMIVKEVGPVVERIDTAAATGQYTLEDDGTLTFGRAALDWHQLQDESEAFFLRIYAAGDYRWKGADLGVIVTKGRLQRETETGYELTDRARQLIDAVRAQYSGTPVAATPAPIAAAK